MRIRAGSLADLRSAGLLLVGVGRHRVCVFWDEGRAYALDDRCPHMGFPLHRGTVECGLVTCHWHHARFDLASGGTFDPFADDVRAFPVEIDGEEVYVVDDGPDGQVEALRRRLDDGLEQGLTLVIAKAVLGLLDAGVPSGEIVRAGVAFGTANRQNGWGSGLTVLTAMANLLPALGPADRPLALVHGLSFVARDTRNRPPRFPLEPLGRAGVAPERLTEWYRRFVETRSADAAERALATAIAGGLPAAAVSDLMFAAVTDHVFLDGGHTIDFTNKGFEALDHLGWEQAALVLPTLVSQTAGASRSEEGSRWRHPHDLAALVVRTNARLPALLAEGGARAGGLADADVAALAWRMVDEEGPEAVVDSVCAAIVAGATPEQLGRAVALGAALRITRFHTQNDQGDWDVVHHGFTAASALHRALARHPSPALVRGVVHGALRTYLDRFLNVPAARLPQDVPADLAGLQACWDQQGGVDRAGAIAYAVARADGGTPAVVAALGSALLAEDAEFHWFQVVEAAAAEAASWPPGSEEAGLILAGAARFLAAHTPTRRELAHVVRIATRLRRGDEVFAE